MTAPAHLAPPDASGLALALLEATLDYYTRRRDCIPSQQDVTMQIIEALEQMVRDMEEVGNRRLRWLLIKRLARPSHGRQQQCA